MAKNKSGTRVFAIVFRVIGLFFLVAGGVLTFLSYDFMNNALPATGSVVSVEVNYGDDDGVTYQPIIRYVDFEGRKQRGKTFMSSSNYDFEIGSKVNILYDVRDPEVIRVDNWLATWGFGLLLLAASIVPFFIASIIGRVGKRNAKTTPQRKPKRARPAREDEEEMLEFDSHRKGLVARESRSDHERETNYEPTVRRNR